jgi:ribosomal protein L15
MRNTLRGGESHRLFGRRGTRSASGSGSTGGHRGSRWSSSGWVWESIEHGRRDPATNVSDDDEVTTGKIAWAHLNEFPDYYTRLAKMEAEAESYWAERDKPVG